MIQVVEAKNGATESTALVVNDATHGQQQQYQIAILEGVNWQNVTPGFITSHIHVVDTSSNQHDYPA